MIIINIIMIIIYVYTELTIYYLKTHHTRKQKKKHTASLDPTRSGTRLKKSHSRAAFIYDTLTQNKTHLISHSE